jgi:hypothetical protein
MLIYVRMRIKPWALGLVLLVAAPAVAHADWPDRRHHAGPHEAPPPPREEHARTRSGYVWVGGHHEWRGRHYVWISGRLVRQRRGHDWEDGRWERHEDHYDWHRGEWHPHR